MRLPWVSRKEHAETIHAMHRARVREVQAVEDDARQTIEALRHRVAELERQLELYRVVVDRMTWTSSS